MEGGWFGEREIGGSGEWIGEVFVICYLTFFICHLGR